MISIIVPIFNAEEYLQQCLDSLINQSYQDIEIICVNDSSTDNSLSILQSYSYDSRVKIILKENEGVSLARNRGLEEAQGDYIMFVDADDWIDLKTCEIVLDEMEKENADVVMWSYIREFHDKSLRKEIFNSSRIIFEGKQVRTKLHLRCVGLVDRELANPENADALCTVWGKLYKREIIKNYRILFKDIRKIGTYEDGLFNLDIFNVANKVVFLNKCLYHYRRNNSSSITSLYKSDLFSKWENLFEIIKKYIEDNQLPRIYYHALNNRISLSILGLSLNILQSDMSVLKKIQMIKKIISSPKYRLAYRELTLAYFPIHWKVYYWGAKNNFAIIVFIMTACIKKIIGR